VIKIKRKAPGTYFLHFKADRHLRPSFATVYSTIPTMLLLATTVALSFLSSLVNAQSANDTALGVVAIEAHFTNAELVPQLLSTFIPSALMNVTFSGVGAIEPGQNLSRQRESLSSPLLSSSARKKKRKKRNDG